MAEVNPKMQREFAWQVALKLRAAGYQSLLAGGCVRDQLMGRVPKDYDVATNATPDQIRALFGQRRTLAIGAAYGVIAVLGTSQSGPVEVTTFRRDAEYSDGRRPDAVEFCDAEEDALRRDFTINGMFFDPVSNEVIDYVGGQVDIERRVLRAIGDPRLRLQEDKLRMLRAVRFAAAYELHMDDATGYAIAELAHEIDVVSPERIAQELRRMLTCAGRESAWVLLFELGLLRELLPEVLGEGPHANDRSSVVRARAMIAGTSATTFPAVMAAALYEATERAPANCQTMVDAVADRWRLANQERAEIGWLLANRRALDDAATAYWPRLQRVLCSDGIEELLELVQKARQVAGEPDDDVLYCRARVAQPVEVWNPPPLVNGDDLIAAGMRPGKDFKLLLEQLRDAQLLGQIKDKAEGLAWAAAWQRDTRQGEGKT